MHIRTSALRLDAETGHLATELSTKCGRFGQACVYRCWANLGNISTTETSAQQLFGNCWTTTAFARGNFQDVWRAPVRNFRVPLQGRRHR